MLSQEEHKKQLYFNHGRKSGVMNVAPTEATAQTVGALKPRRGAGLGGRRINGDITNHSGGDYGGGKMIAFVGAQFIAPFRKTTEENRAS